MKSIIQIITLSLLIWSCSSQKQTATNSLEEKTKLVISYSQLNDSISDLPEYTIELYSNRQMYLTASKNMDKQGKYMRTLSEKESDQVIKSFIDANFFKFQSEYTRSIEKQPSHILYFSYNGNEKKVKFYDGSNEYLTELEYLMQSFLDRVGWEKMSW